MKKKQKELDVDFIGGGRSLTAEDTKAISAFIQARKKQQAKKKSRLSTLKSRSKSI